MYMKTEDREERFHQSAEILADPAEPSSDLIQIEEGYMLRRAHLTPQQKGLIVQARDGYYANW